MKRKQVLLIILIALLSGIIGGLVSGQFNRKGSFTEANTFENLYQQTTNNENLNKTVVGPDFIASANNTVHAVVHVKTYFERKSNAYNDFFDLFFGMPNQSQVVGTGSGVIISSDGYVVTNNHVVEGASKIEITLNDKRAYEAKILGNDPTTDLALLQIEGQGFPFIKFGDSDELQIGEWVLAVGNPFNLTSTVTAGIVSAKARNINILGSKTAVESFIQTDAAVNPGNSGGALVNVKGDLIGINAAIASNTGSYTGYSFAIPSNLAKKVVKDLAEFGETQRAFMGVVTRNIDAKFAREIKLDRIKGVYVVEVKEKGSANTAGMKSGDIITHIGGREVNSQSQMVEQVAMHRPGEIIEVKVKRDNVHKTYQLKLSNKYGTSDELSKKYNSLAAELGAEFVELTDKEMNQLNVDHGLRVINIKNGKLSHAGMRNNFIILSVDSKEVNSENELLSAISAKEGGVLIEGMYRNGTRAYYGVGL